MSTIVISIIITLLYFCYIEPALKKRKAHNYWSPEQSEKRWKLEEEKRKRDLMEWYNSIVAQNRSAS